MKPNSLKKKVLLFVCNTDWFFVSHRSEIAQACVRIGYEVHLAAPAGDEVAKIKEMGLTFHDVNFGRRGQNPITELRTFKELAQIIIKIKPDIIHAITPKPVIYAGLLSRFFAVPSLVLAVSGLGHIYSSKGVGNSLRKFVVSLLYKLALKHPNFRVIFQNSNDQFIFRNLYPKVQFNDILVYGSGVNLEKYNFQKEVESDKILILMASRMLKSKGIYEFVQAAHALSSLKKSVHFLLMGKVDDHPDGLSEVELGLLNKMSNFSWIGHRDDVEYFLRLSSVVTLPSYYGEGMPKIMLEAAACGRAVVTTDSPGCRDTVDNGVTGFVVPTQDPAALVEKYKILIESPKLRYSMGAEARSRAERKFSVINIVTAHLEIYRSVSDSART